MKIPIKLLTLLVFLLIFGYTQSLSAQTPTQNMLTYGKFADLLVKVIGLEIPEGAELLSDEEYYEVTSNMLAEKAVNDFLNNDPDALVTRAGMAEVLYVLCGGTEKLSPDKKIDYLIGKDYMPRAYLDSGVTFVEGDVLILKKDAKEWQKANPGDALEDGDTVKTLENSRVKLQFSPGGKVILKEDTSLKINTVDSNGPLEGGGTDLFLSKGDIKALVTRLEEGSTFEVKTPTAVCGIRGTVFYVSLDALFNTGLFVEEAKVEFINFISKLLQEVGENESSFSDGKGNLTKPVFISLDERGRWTVGFEGTYNAIKINFDEGVLILNNPALAELLAEAYSEAGGRTGGFLGTQVQNEGPATPI